MKHTFIFEPGLWRATGVYSDEKGDTVAVNAETTIKHADDLWINEGIMHLELGQGNIVEIRNNYRIKPFSANKEYTSWISDNPALGQINGMFIVIDDTILSTYKTEREDYHGTECLNMIDKNTYKNRGALFMGEMKISSWAVTLKRET